MFGRLRKSEEKQQHHQQVSWHEPLIIEVVGGGYTIIFRKRTGNGKKDWQLQLTSWIRPWNKIKNVFTFCCLLHMLKTDDFNPKKKLWNFKHDPACVGRVPEKVGVYSTQNCASRCKVGPCRPVRSRGPNITPLISGSKNPEWNPFFLGHL